MAILHVRKKSADGFNYDWLWLFQDYHPKWLLRFWGKQLGKMIDGKFVTALNSVVKLYDLCRLTVYAMEHGRLVICSETVHANSDWFPVRQQIMSISVDNCRGGKHATQMRRRPGENNERTKSTFWDHRDVKSKLMAQQISKCFKVVRNDTTKLSVIFFTQEVRGAVRRNETPNHWCWLLW